VSHSLLRPSPKASGAVRPPVIWLTPVPDGWSESLASRERASRDKAPRERLPRERFLWNKSFLQSWFEDDAVASGSRESARTNWGAIGGMALSIAISASFWTGVGLIVERIWK